MSVKKRASKKIQTTLKPSLFDFVVTLANELELSHSQAIAYCVAKIKDNDNGMKKD